MRGMDATTGTWLDGQEHLMQSIRLILATPINTRVMLPEFGSDVPNLISAPMTAANRLRLYAAATEAITRWEPRITVKKVEVTGEGANGEIDLVIEGEYDGDVFSIPIINVGVIMRGDSFWIKDLTIVLPEGTDKIPVSKRQSDGSYGPDEAVTVSSLLALIGGGSNFSIAALDAGNPLAASNIAFEQGGTMYKGTLNQVLSLLDLSAYALNSALSAYALNSALSAYVLNSALEGQTNDQFASYDNALFGAGYFPGNWCLFNQTTQPTDDTNAIGQPNITTGSGVILWGDLRDDSNPDASWTPETLVAADWASGKIIHISPWHPYDASGHLKVTLTSDASLVGTGNAQHLWAQATWDEIGNFNDVATVGDYSRWSENTPSQLKFDLPVESIPNLPLLYALLDGSNVTQKLKDAIQGDNESVTLSPDFRVDVTNVDYYVSWADSNTPKIATVRLPSSQANTQTDTDLKRLLHPASWLKVGDWTGAVTTNATRSLIGTSLTFAFNYETLEGTIPTGSNTYKITVVGEDVHRGELERIAFAAEKWNALSAQGTPAPGDLGVFADKNDGYKLKHSSLSAMVAAGIPLQRMESLKFKAVTDSVGGDLNTSQTLSLDGTTPVAVNYGQGSAEYISGTANASTFTVLKAGIYMISVSASIDIGTTDRAQPYFQIQQNSDSSSIGQTPSKYGRFGNHNNIQYYETGFLIVDADNTVCKLVALHDRLSDTIHPTYTVDAGTILSLTRFL